ncbi:MAG TPA: GNAT family N-acetyltransferase [Mycobacteriales bacterium]|nr:GNAT family N-acetyltransferase [Mycobacteriales bacterium]
MELRPFTLSDALALLAGDRRPDWHPEFPADGDITAATHFRVQADSDGDPQPFGPRLIALDGVVVGMCGVTRGPDERGTVEVGYGVVEAVRHRGVASRALRALVEELRELEVRRIVATTEQDNVASQGVLVQAGFHIVGEDAELVLWELDLVP